MEITIYNQNRIENCKDGIKRSDRKEVIGYSRGIVKENNDDRDDVNIEDSSYKWLEVEKTESVKETNVDSPLDGAGFDSQVDCDSGQREYITEVLKCDSDIKKERIDPEAADYLLVNSEDGIIRSNRNRVIKYSRGIVKQNEVVDEEMNYKWLELEKNEDVKNEAITHIPLYEVDCDSQYGEQMTFMLNTSRDEVDCDNRQSEHNMSEFLKLDNIKIEKNHTEVLKYDINIKEEISDHEDMVIDMEKCVRYETTKQSLQASLEKHSELEHNVSKKGKLHQCQFCDYKCKFNYILKQHFETKHSQTADWHYCEYCEYKAKDRKRLMFHFKCKHDANAARYKCCFCDYESKDKSSFLKHYKTRHDQDCEWHNCQYCAFKTKHKRSLQAHLECKHNIVSEKGRLHQCQFCDYFCKFKFVLKQHLKTKHS